jgi:hypothetical protein
MPKYNPKNKQHRKTLAKRISKMLLGNGFLTTMEYGWITYDVYQFEGSRKIDVFTKIWMDELEKDATKIEIQASGLNPVDVALKGDMDGITSRLLRAILKMKKASIKEKTVLIPSFDVGDLVRFKNARATLNDGRLGIVLPRKNGDNVDRTKVFWLETPDAPQAKMDTLTELIECHCPF